MLGHTITTTRSSRHNWSAHATGHLAIPWSTVSGDRVRSVTDRPLVTHWTSHKAAAIINQSKHISIAPYVVNESEEKAVVQRNHSHSGAPSYGISSDRSSSTEKLQQREASVEHSDDGRAMQAKRCWCHGAPCRAVVSVLRPPSTTTTTTKAVHYGALAIGLFRLELACSDVMKTPDLSPDVLCTSRIAESDHAGKAMHSVLRSLLAHVSASAAATTKQRTGKTEECWSGVVVVSQSAGLLVADLSSSVFLSTWLIVPLLPLSRRQPPRLLTRRPAVLPTAPSRLSLVPYVLCATAADARPTLLALGRPDIGFNYSP